VPVPRPRVLLVAARVPPDVGGVETHVAEVAPRLARDGFDVTILATDRSGSRSRLADMGGVPLVRVSAYPRSRDYYLAPGLPRALAEVRPDLVHVQGYHTLVAPLAMGAALARRIPFVVSFHSGGHPSALRNRARPLQRLVLRPLLRRAARLVAVSRFEMDLFRRELRLSGDRFSLVRNGSSLPSPSSENPPGTDAPIVVTVGRLERYKGQRRLVRAWPAVLRRVPTASLCIVGTGSDEDAIRKEVARLGLERRVSLMSLAASDRQGMADVLGRASLFALLSDFEAHPVAVMEALGTGTPALVARTSGLTELVDDGLAAGLDADSSDDEVADAVVRALERPVPADPARLPTWDGTARELGAIYRSILAGSP
jgi:glycosyltransferase involved in cell wall biosynthesis